MLSSRFRLEGQAALITGAAGGIGAELSLQLAAMGVHLALADIDEQALENVQAECRKHNVRVSSHPIDLSHDNAAAQLADEVIQKHGELALLFNNAGVALGGNFSEISEYDFDWLMAVNFSTPVKLIRALLPEMEKVAEARIVNISSLFGLVAPPGQTAYAASKFALRGFSEALRHELQESSVGVTVVHPGGVRTRIARNARITGIEDVQELEEKISAMESHLKMPAGKAADIILKAVKLRKKRVLVGRDARILDFVQRLSPGNYWKHISRTVKAEPAKS